MNNVDLILLRLTQITICLRIHVFYVSLSNEKELYFLQMLFISRGVEACLSVSPAHFAINATQKKQRARKEENGMVNIDSFCILWTLMWIIWHNIPPYSSWVWVNGKTNAQGAENDLFVSMRDNMFFFSFPSLILQKK